MKKETPEFINKIDFTTLRTQKTTLLKVIDQLENDGNSNADDLTGILHLIDALQDYAVDELDIPAMHVYDFELEEERDMTSVKKPELYFQIVHSGYQEGIGREEIQVHAGENGNIFLIKTNEGIIVDVYGQNDIVDSLSIFEDDLNPDDEEPVEETGAPENFSDEEIKAYLKEWGQKQGEITSNLEYPKSHAESDELLMEDYFFLEGRKEWYPKISRMYSEREQAIADYVRNDRDKY
jgi:hypothetical protein